MSETVPGGSMLGYVRPYDTRVEGEGRIDDVPRSSHVRHVQSPVHRSPLAGRAARRGLALPLCTPSTSFRMIQPTRGRTTFAYRIRKIGYTIQGHTLSQPKPAAYTC